MRFKGSLGDMEHDVEKTYIAFQKGFLDFSEKVQRK